MTNEQTKKLALDLLRADSEAAVIEALKTAGLWDNAPVWRLVGDREGNFATIGAQQSRSEAALVEKIVNSVDARLMNECLVRGIDPSSERAPSSIRHAVSRFFENREPKGAIGGTLESWPQSKQLEQSQYITLAATGAMPRAGDPCLTIVDCGEGQTPSAIPRTFLSIDRNNKLKILFVQGKFNMGGTGALRFCGQNSLQLIITKRNPAITSDVKESDPTSGHWGVTIVRRERPIIGAGHVKNAVYSYLAPVGADERPNRGDVLSFDADALPLMPDQNRPYARSIRWGSAIKLYEYDMKGFRSHVLMKGGLLSRLELLLPTIALPVRVHECRAYKGEEARSFANTLVGTVARLEENRGDNLEPGFPASVPLVVHGEQMVAKIYAFKADKAESYRTNEGIIFVINGQTHGAIPKTFFERSRVKMGRLATSLLVVVECSDLSVGAREDLFMNSRDRLSNKELRKAIEEELEDLISHHPGLRELRERRRADEIKERLQDSRPLEEVIGSILKSSPTLARLFLLGQRLNQPHRTEAASAANGNGGGPKPGNGEFKGRKHPTFFRFHRKGEAEMLVRHAEMGRHCRIKFETDVENDYFSRGDLPGHYHVELLDGPVENVDLDHSLTLHNGIGNWSINLPTDNIAVGDELTLQCTVADDVVPTPFVSIAKLTVVEKSKPGTSTPGRRVSRKGTGTAGSGGSGDSPNDEQDDTGEQLPGGIQLPDIVEVHENDTFWAKYKFDDKTACKVIEDAVGDEDDEKSTYTFYVNVDNLYLKTDMKGAGNDVALMKAKFIYGNVLVGLALIHDNRGRVNNQGSSDESMAEESVERIVDRTTRAMGAFLVPMIDYLGAMSADEAAGIAAQAGDEE